MKRIVLAAAAILGALLCGCGETGSSEGIFIPISPSFDGEFGEALRSDGSYLNERVLEPAEDPYVSDTEPVSEGVTPAGVTYTLYREHAEITGHTDDFSAETLEIPAELGGLPVTRIADAETDEENRFLQSGAFNGCYSLKSAVLPETLTKIGSCAFYGCRNLKSISIPESVTEIGTRAFSMCAGLEKLNVPEAIGKIGTDAFSLTPWYDTLLSESSLIIFNGILYDTGKLCTGDIVIPDYVQEIADCAFYCTPNMDSVEIPASVQRIGQSAFLTCHELRKVVLYNPQCDIAPDVRTFSNKLEEGNVDYFKGTFYAAEGSTLQRWAERHGYDFTALT